MNDGSLTESGITLFKSEMTTFEQTSTKVVASPMAIPFFAIVVTASVGHIPSSVTNTGFSFISPFTSSALAFFSLT
jgi:hypothetical protein